VNWLALAERLGTGTVARVNFDSHRCLHTLDKGSGCAACTRACPVRALHPGRPPALDPAACTGCGACGPVCPAGALAPPDPVPALLACVARTDAREIELLCARHPAPSTGLPAPTRALSVPVCLAGLGAGAYARLTAVGVKQVTLRLDGCERCAWGTLQAQAEAQADAARRLLAAWQRPVTLQCLLDTSAQALEPRHVWDTADPPVSRRDVLNPRAWLRAAPRSEKPLGAARGPARERAHLLLATATWRLPDPAITPLDGLGFARLEATDACTACGACARACPSGALRFEQSEDAFTLAHAAPVCSACGACVHACTARALTLDTRPTLAGVFGAGDLRVLLAGRLVACERCGAPHAAHDNARLCRPCAARALGAFAGWRGGA